jgi:hypothetical protein
MSAKTSGSSSGMRERSRDCPSPEGLSLKPVRTEDSAISSTHSSTAEPEQVDLQETGIGAGVLVPLDQLPPRHRGRHHRHELDQRAAGDDHSARVLRGVARQAADLAAEVAERAPARRAELGLSVRQRGDLVGDPPRIAFREPRQPLELRMRQAECHPDVADRAARVVGRKCSDQRGVLAPVLVADRREQLLADVAREVEVDVGYRGHVSVEEAAEREPRRHRVDVREPGQVANDRADGAAATATRRQRRARRVAAAHLDRQLPRQLEHLPVEEEEAGQAELVDQLQLLVEAGSSPPLLSGA